MKPLRCTGGQPDFPITPGMFLSQLQRCADEIAEGSEYDPDQVRAGLRRWIAENAAVIRDQCRSDVEITDAVIEAAVANSLVIHPILSLHPRVPVQVPITEPDQQAQLLALGRALVADGERITFDWRGESGGSLARLFSDLSKAGKIIPPLGVGKAEELQRIIQIKPIADATALPRQPSTLPARAATAPAPKPVPDEKFEFDYDAVPRAVTRHVEITDAEARRYARVLKYARSKSKAQRTDGWWDLIETHGKLANALGVSRHTMLRFINKMIRLGAIRVRGTVTRSRHYDTHYLIARGKGHPLPVKLDSDTTGIPKGYTGRAFKEPE